MSFAAPFALLLAATVPALVVWYVRVNRRRSERAMRLAAEALVVTGPAAARRRRRHIPFALFATALAALVVSVARPQVDLTKPRREGTVVLAFDVSNSMRADDVKPTRLAAAKDAATAFVRAQPSAVRIGVVAFGEGATIVQAPTTNRSDVLDAIGRLSPGGGTSVAQGLFTSLSAIAGGPLTVDPDALESDIEDVDIGYFGGTAVVLLSDGENTDRLDPSAVAELASAAGVKVHPVGIGTPDGAVVEIDGFQVATSLDADTLKEVADVTDGTYRHAVDAAELRQVYESIELRFTTVVQPTEVTALFAAAGLALVVAAVALSLLWNGRVI